ncbi:lysine N-methyltransferase setd3 [Seminavis robusta]|uniref:Lysine N-methyltransferase setd3 n=1 Tax=Seminavis robusta TaxID=568900 RepID=A0A9N8H3H5_9STRA|nr:lysine N-methyltransferase setd3 [Seminavis robusta]|eukprot:Sro26_g017890.1 lysine N-methyltransferase setd3 (523) ;mRNA; f:146570-148138
MTSTSTTTSGQGSDKENDSAVFDTLKDWIEKGGGTVHAGLFLGRQKQGSLAHGMRGIFTQTAIPKGELLLKVPSKLVLSGEKLPRKFKDRIASPWLRCLACIYSAQQGDREPYLASLPASYETLWQWHDDQVQYLEGTTLGETLKADRTDGSLEQRYEEYVKPYLRFLKIIGKKKEQDNPMQAFRQASMCISTRGFHMKPEEADIGKETYMGPFLLPLIDLLNHNPANKATTLQRDAGGFYMVAERDIDKGEEIVHSYGDTLTAAQVLQTFGFVPESMIRQATGELAVASASASTSTTITPAIFSKEELVAACMSVKNSSSPKQLQQAMKDNEIEGEVWDLPKDAEKRDMSLIPDQLLVVPSESSNNSFISDEMVTLCAIQMLPKDVYDEIFNEDEDPKLLGQEILEDYFLGKLALMAILTATKTKLATYTPLSNVPGITDKAKKEEDDDDKHILKELLQLETYSASALRALYGITIRLEEKATLHELQTEAVSLMAALDDEDGDDDDDDDRPAKKMKSASE